MARSDKQFVVILSRQEKQIGCGHGEKITLRRRGHVDVSGAALLASGFIE